MIANLASGQPALGFVASAITLPHGSPLHELSYIWQLYLPRLPGMHDDFAGLFTTRQIWFNWYVGLYGWLDTTFPGWVYDVALIPAAAIAGLRRELVASAGALRARCLELAVYVLICIGLMALIGGTPTSGSRGSTPNSGTAATCCRCCRCWVPCWPWPRAARDGAGGRRPAPRSSCCSSLTTSSASWLVARFYG